MPGSRSDASSLATTVPHDVMFPKYAAGDAESTRCGQGSNVLLQRVLHWVLVDLEGVPVDEVLD